VPLPHNLLQFSSNLVNSLVIVPTKLLGPLTNGLGDVENYILICHSQGDSSSNGGKVHINFVLLTSWEHLRHKIIFKCKGENWLQGNLQKTH
jgi:hypothetical protein